MPAAIIPLRPLYLPPHTWTRLPSLMCLLPRDGFFTEWSSLCSSALSYVISSPLSSLTRTLDIPGSMARNRNPPGPMPAAIIPLLPLYSPPHTWTRLPSLMCLLPRDSFFTECCNSALSYVINSPLSSLTRTLDIPGSIAGSRNPPGPMPAAITPLRPLYFPAHTCTRRPSLMCLLLDAEARHVEERFLASVTWNATISGGHGIFSTAAEALSGGPCMLERTTELGLVG